jgi:hypothetical protein
MGKCLTFWEQLSGIVFAIKFIESYFFNFLARVWWKAWQIQNVKNNQISRINEKVNWLYRYGLQN